MSSAGSRLDGSIGMNMSESAGPLYSIPDAAFSPKVSCSSTEMSPLPPSVTSASNQVSVSWLYHTYSPFSYAAMPGSAAGALPPVSRAPLFPPVVAFARPAPAPAG
eukprot:SAG22_NODE_272_length_13192_cov_311.812495_5_plen_106_part_00